MQLKVAPSHGTKLFPDPTIPPRKAIFLFPRVKLACDMNDKLIASAGDFFILTFSFNNSFSPSRRVEFDSFSSSVVLQRFRVFSSERSAWRSNLWLKHFVKRLFRLFMHFFLNRLKWFVKLSYFELSLRSPSLQCVFNFFYETFLFSQTLKTSDNAKNRSPRRKNRRPRQSYVLNVVNYVTEAFSSQKKQNKTKQPQLWARKAPVLQP